MTRPPPRLAFLLALLLGLLLTGCPLPQAVPTYPSTGKKAPPRIDADSASPAESSMEIRPDCATPPTIVLGTTLVDEDTLEQVEARWFVDYLASSQARRSPVATPEIIAAPSDGVTTVRPLTPLRFEPYGFDPQGNEQAFRDGGGIHVVELVVSNGFAPEGAETVARPYRTPAATFQTQVFRWVFHYAATGVCALP